GQRDLAVEIIAEGDETIAALPEPLQVAPEVLGRAGPARLRPVDLVILEDHDPTELVGGERLGMQQGGQRQGGGKTEKRETHVVTRVTSWPRPSSARARRPCSRSGDSTAS